ncbi:AMP-binding protein [Vibrio sp. PP-XX7]
MVLLKQPYMLRISLGQVVLRIGAAIGEPISDLDVIVMDQFGHPLPIGWPGEMFIAGEGLAKGYFNRVSDK